MVFCMSSIIHFSVTHIRLYAYVCMYVCICIYIWNKWSSVTYEESNIIWNICVLQFSSTHSRIFNDFNGLKFRALHVHVKICRILKICPTFRQLFLIRGQQEPKGHYIKHLSWQQKLLYRSIFCWKFKILFCNHRFFEDTARMLRQFLL